MPETCFLLIRHAESTWNAAGRWQGHGDPPLSARGVLQAERLAGAIRAVLMDAIDAGGSSLRDYVHADGELGFFQDRFAVYGRVGQPCQRCGQPIRRFVQANRATFHCPRCQR